MGCCLWVLHVSFISVSPRFSLVLDPRGRLEGLAGRLEVLVRNWRTVRVLYWVNVLESSGAGPPRLSRIKGR